MSMSTLYVRDIPEKVYRQAQEIAAQQGRSLSAYVVEILEQAIVDEQMRRVRSKALASIRRRRRQRQGLETPDSVIVMREIRGSDE